MKTTHDSSSRSRKLSIARQTLRRLSAAQATLARGGATGPSFRACPESETCAAGAPSR